MVGSCGKLNIDTREGNTPLMSMEPSEAFEKYCGEFCSFNYDYIYFEVVVFEVSTHLVVISTRVVYQGGGLTLRKHLPRF